MATLAARIRQLRAAGLNPTSVLVQLVLDEHGFMEAAKLADMLAVSTRTIQASLAAIRKAAVPSASRVEAQDLSDHGHDPGHGLVHGPGSDQDGSVRSARDEGFVALTDADPLIAALVAEGIFPGAAVNLLKAHGRDRVEQQLVHHAKRKAMKFAFAGAPARHLYKAIVNDFAAPWVEPAGSAEARDRKADERKEAAAHRATRAAQAKTPTMAIPLPGDDGPIWDDEGDEQAAQQPPAQAIAAFVMASTAPPPAQVPVDDGPAGPRTAEEAQRLVNQLAGPGRKPTSPLYAQAYRIAQEWGLPWSQPLPIAR